MDFIPILLGVVIIFLLYLLISFYRSSETVLTETANLSQTIPPIEITNSRGSSSYAYGIWIFVSNWDSNKTKTIFKRANNLTVSLDNTSPKLRATFTMTDDSEKDVIITDNMPLQKWVYITISVDGQYVDGYIDGKLVKSSRVISEVNSDVFIPKMPTSTAKMQLGDGDGFDASIARFKHWAHAVDPQTVWNSYLQGNGQGSWTSTLSDYGVDLSILRNNVETTRFSLF
jgi:hypothetical protein